MGKDYTKRENVKRYPNKLVRDNIPTLIVKENKTCTFSKLLKSEDILEARKNKIFEEINELKEAILKDSPIEDILNELGDVVTITMYWLFGDCDLNTLTKYIKDKNLINGEFKENYILKEVFFNEEE